MCRPCGPCRPGRRRLQSGRRGAPRRLVRHHASPAELQAVQPQPGARPRHGARHGRGAHGRPQERRPAHELAYPDVRVAQPREVRLRDLLPRVPRRGGKGGRAHRFRPDRRFLSRRAVARDRPAREAERRLHLRRDREHAGDGPGPDAPLRRQGARDRPLGPRELRPDAAGAGPQRRRPVSAAPAAARAELVRRARAFPVRGVVALGAVAALVGGAVFLWALGSGRADRAWQAYHVNFMFWIGLAQASVVFAATQKLAKGHWSGVVIRFAEAAAPFLIVALALFLGLFFGRQHVFSWLHEPRPDIGPWLTTAFFFMGSFLAALMALAVGAVLLRRAMRLGDLISPRQLHDLGKLCFGFTVFWGYLMWAQFLVIWYGNLPEETYFIFYRLIGQWKPVGVAVFFLVLVIPFVGLLGVKPKKSPAILLAFAATSLVGIWLERYLEIVPSINGGAGPALGGPELGVTLLFGGLYLLAIGWFAARFPMISPRLAADTLERERH